MSETLRILNIALAGLLLCGAVGCSVDTSLEESIAETGNGLTAPDESAHLLVLVRSDNGAFQVVGSRRVDTPLPRRRGDTKQAGWSYRAAGVNGAPAQGILDNPHTLRGDFKERDGHTSGTAITRSGPATFAVRVPLGTKVIDFFDQRLPVLAAAAAAGAKAAGASADATPPGALRLGSVSLP